MREHQTGIQKEMLNPDMTGVGIVVTRQLRCSNSGHSLLLTSTACQSCGCWKTDHILIYKVLQGQGAKAGCLQTQYTQYHSRIQKRCFNEIQ